MSDLTLPSFRYNLEQQPPRTERGGARSGRLCSAVPC